VLAYRRWREPGASPKLKPGSLFIEVTMEKMFILMLLMSTIVAASTFSGRAK
jgi:hypothetical protein